MPDALIFLDFDGVLNSSKFFTEREFNNEEWVANDFDPKAIALLNGLIAETGAQCVVSSSWRIMFTLEELRKVLKAAGFTGALIDVTPQWDPYDGEWEGNERGYEIQRWLDKKKYKGKFVILDDDADMVHLSNKLVKTDFADGLTFEKIQQAKEVLKS